MYAFADDRENAKKPEPRERRVSAATLAKVLEASKTTEPAPAENDMTPEIFLKQFNFAFSTMDALADVASGALLKKMSDAELKKVRQRANKIWDWSEQLTVLCNSARRAREAKVKKP